MSGNDDGLYVDADADLPPRDADHWRPVEVDFEPSAPADDYCKDETVFDVLIDMYIENEVGDVQAAWDNFENHGERP